MFGESIPGRNRIPLKGWPSLQRKCGPLVEEEIPHLSVTVRLAILLPEASLS